MEGNAFFAPKQITLFGKDPAQISGMAIRQAYGPDASCLRECIRSEQICNAPEANKPQWRSLRFLIGISQLTWSLLST